jgi:septum formation protein
MNRRISSALILVLTVSPTRRADGTLSVACRCDNAGVERQLVLASGSPRRRALLRDAGYVFAVDAPDVDEVVVAGEGPEQMVMRLAKKKAVAVIRRWPRGICVLGCDTTVVLDDEMLGKPEDAEDAITTLLRIAGRSHAVVSGFAIVTPDAVPILGAVWSEVFMTPIGRDEAAAYVATGEPMDKAGSYAIQGLGRRFVDHFEGSFSNIMGLPMETVQPALAQIGISPNQPGRPPSNARDG